MLPANYRLVFTGLSEEGLLALERHKVFDKAILCERLPFQGLLALYSICDVGVLFYANDGIGNFYQAPGRLTEYMSVGTPFVASAFPNFELLSLKYNIGKVCNSSNPKSIADCLHTVCDKSYDKLLLERKRLRALAKTQFCYETTAEEILSTNVQL